MHRRVPRAPHVQLAGPPGRWPLAPGEFDVVHDNQTFGRSLLGVMADGWPLLGTCHHPITVDRTLDLAHAANWRRRLVLRRWYGFVAMQKKVARQIPRILTVSSSSKRDIVEQYGLAPDQLEVVPIGVDDTHFRPHPEVARVPGRIMTTASADVPFKGLLPAGRGGRQAPHRAPRGRTWSSSVDCGPRARWRRPSPGWACPGR